jgi:hypothetical protein
MEWLWWVVVIWMVAVVYYLQKISHRLYALAVGMDATNSALRSIEDSIDLIQKNTEPNERHEQP